APGGSSPHLDPPPPAGEGRTRAGGVGGRGFGSGIGFVAGPPRRRPAHRRIRDMREADARRACDIVAADYDKAARGQSPVSRRERVRRITTVSQSSARAAIDAFGRGEIIVVTDDDDRENEGDLILAAVHATPEKMAFIIRHTCGIVCAPVTGEIARRLHLAPMVADADAIHGTAFTISVDYKHSTTPGISPE